MAFYYLWRISISNNPCFASEQPVSPPLNQQESPAHLERVVQRWKADNLSQVTSVSQLSDVQPTDWAFQAVQSLVERYGCIAGYPDGSFAAIVQRLAMSLRLRSMPA